MKVWKKIMAMMNGWKGTKSSDEDSDRTWPSLPNSPFRPSLPNSPNRLEAVEDLLGGSDTE